MAGCVLENGSELVRGDVCRDYGKRQYSKHRMERDTESARPPNSPSLSHNHVVYCVDYHSEERRRANTSSSA